ncbi:MAG TPA: response regulator, partial [Polyangiaceae bacterium]|nr:response regulator [Polyangiaceae bacterium]
DAADDRVRAFNLGAEAYFEKPFDLDLLFATIVNQAAKRETDAPPPQDEVEWEQEGLDASYAEIDRRQAEAFTLAQEQRASERRIRASVSGRAPVLVIEDDQSIRQSLCNILEDEGVPTMSASNGREALELLRTLPVAPALILLDLMMPVMDGWEFRKALAGDASLPKARVVVMSARARDEALGPVVWLQKPLALEQLLATVHEQARRSA